MKRIRCPKCDSYLTFDETRYTEGQTLVFECNECHRQFGIRIGKSKLLNTRKDERRIADEKDLRTNLCEHLSPAASCNTAEESSSVNSQFPISDEQPDCGHLLVIENVFHYKQILPLCLGDNVIGRYVRGSGINTPIETVDPSVDTKHCIINVSRNRHGEFVYTLRDASTDGTGTFVGTTFLSVTDRLRITDGTIITIGATTMILRAAGYVDEETTAEEKKRRR
ncbi:MAG: FHA domain-containing protein [Bacteroidaceae bacterium]|nr:FHA domain-containing protein [Bacteroidaceae bacterium]